MHETNNLADTVFGGAPVGVTRPVMNSAITSSSAAVHSALVAPTVTTTAATGGGFDAEVDTVPTNVGSFDETVLSAGPWRTTTAKANFHALFPRVAGCGGAGDTRFRAFGDPDDAAMFAANRRHEDHHAADVRAAFNDIILPWDQKITAAKAARTKFHGDTAVAAQAALWGAMGGTAAQIVDAFVARVVADGNAFHATARGGTVKLSTRKRAGARPDCSISWAHLVNPS